MSISETSFYNRFAQSHPQGLPGSLGWSASETVLHLCPSVLPSLFTWGFNEDAGCLSGTRPHLCTSWLRSLVSLAPIWSSSGTSPGDLIKFISPRKHHRTPGSTVWLLPSVAHAWALGLGANTSLAEFHANFHPRCWQLLLTATQTQYFFKGCKRRTSSRLYSFLHSDGVLLKINCLISDLKGRVNTWLLPFIYQFP